MPRGLHAHPQICYLLLHDIVLLFLEGILYED